MDINNSLTTVPPWLWLHANYEGPIANKMLAIADAHRNWMFHKTKSLKSKLIKVNSPMPLVLFTAVQASLLGLAS